MSNNNNNNNRKVVLISAKPTSGKTACLHGMTNQESTIYLNADIKPIPFKHKFLHDMELPDPKTIIAAINKANEMDNVDFIALDTISKLMENFERLYVTDDTRPHGAAWQDYAKFYGDVIHALKAGNKNVAVFGHVKDIMNDQEMSIETAVPIKGAVGKIGIEADFSIILTAKRVPLSAVEELSNEFLHVTPDDKENGFKYVLQTRIDKDTIGDKTRSPMGMWERNEKYIDNNLDFVFKRINDYYGE